MAAHETLDRARSMLLVIDVQVKLLPHLAPGNCVVGATAALMEGARLFDLPMLGTEQYVKGLGATHPELSALASKVGLEFVEKQAFSVCRDAECARRAKDMGRSQVIVAGIEAHVCVQQTVLDLRSMGLSVYVCADAVASRRNSDRRWALRRMGEAGAIVTTTEAVLFELCEVSGTDAFKQMLGIVKRFDEARAARG